MKSGVFEYWIVEPANKTIAQYYFTEERKLDDMKLFQKGGIISSNKFAGLEIALKDIFAEI